MKIIRVSVLMAAAACVVLAPHPGKSQMMVIAATGVAPQVKDDVFAGVEKFAQGATDVSDVNLDKNMLGMAGKSGDGRANKLDFIVVHTYKYDKPGMYKMEDVEVYRKRLMDGSWSCSIHTRDKDGTTDICSRSTDGETSEMVVMTAEPKELTFIHMKGRGLSMGDLGMMGTGMGHHHAPPAPPSPPLLPLPPLPPAPPAAPRP